MSLSRAEETAAAAGFRDVVARAVKAGRADVCQRALDVAAVVSHLAPFVLETLFAPDERETGFAWLARSSPW